MEVHSHAHTPRKKWTHYLWEFIMLFLAVFCGFLAEYQLEHVIEHQREKQYMQSMIEDLKSDTAMFVSNIQIRNIRITMMDSLVLLLTSSAPDKNGNDIYFFGRSISPPANIFSNDGTIQQLKSAGNLRLIQNKIIANKIMNYDQQIRQYFFEMGDEVEIRAAYRQLAIKMFDTKVFYQMEQTDNFLRPTGNPKLLNTSPELINELIGNVQYLKKVHQTQLRRSEKLLVEAKKLIEQIKQEYHLG